MAFPTLLYLERTLRPNKNLLETLQNMKNTHSLHINISLQGKGIIVQGGLYSLLGDKVVDVSARVSSYVTSKKILLFAAISYLFMENFELAHHL